MRTKNIEKSTKNELKEHTKNELKERKKKRKLSDWMQQQQQRKNIKVQMVEEFRQFLWFALASLLLELSLAVCLGIIILIHVYFCPRFFAFDR